MSDKYISRDNLELAIDGLKVGMTPDWNENDKSAVGYIENRPFYTEYGVIVDNYSGSGKRPKCNFVVGNVYDVIWNGVTYKGLVCHTVNGHSYIGGSGYPFYIDDDGGNGFYVEPESGFTVSILGDIVHQLDEKYIPDSVTRYIDVISDNTTKISDNTTKISDNTKKINTLNSNLNALEKETMTYESVRTIIPYGYWSDMAYGGGRFVAVGTAYDAASSTDGVTWTSIKLPSVGGWMSITYGNNKFVAVGRESKVAYSDNGKVWGSATLPTPMFPRAIAYGNNKFVVVGNGIGANVNIDKVAYSTDGITWAEATLPFSDVFVHIAYGDGKFVAIANDTDKAAYSTDGITWTEVTLPFSGKWEYIIYGDGKFVAFDRYMYTDKAAYSTDGITWTEVTLPYTGSPIATYGNGKFVAMFVTNGENKVAYSTDGITWTEVLSLTRYCNAICYGNDMFVAILGRDEVIYSEDGINWHTGYERIVQDGNIITDNIKDIILPISNTTQVGQTIVVKSVDENGNPTEWEAVDMPSGESISLDTTLTVEGKAADAKVVGDALAEKQPKGNYLTSYTETDPTVPAWAKASKKPSYTANEVGADASGTAESLVNAHNVDTSVHADIREEIEKLSEKIEAKVESALSEAKASGEFDGKDGLDATPVTPLFANSIEECTDTTKLYVLPDGFIYAYRYVEGTLPSYTNLAGTITYDKRLSSSGKVSSSAMTGAAYTDFIPVKQGQTVRIKNFDIYSDFSSSAYPYVCFYTGASESNVVSSTAYVRPHDLSDEFSGIANSVNGDVVTWTAFEIQGSAQHSLASSITHIRISGKYFSDKEIIVTVDEEITEGGSAGGYAWTNTGHAFVPADYEAEILALQKNKADKSAIPTKLPNPNALTIDGVKYDGSVAVNIETQSGGNILYGKKWVACGDSFTANGYNTSDGFDESVYIYQDGRFAGRYKVYPNIIGLRNNMDIVNLASGGQTMAASSNSFMSVYSTIPTDADYITIMLGINDKVQGLAVGTLEDSTNTTFCGAFNIAMEHILENHPFAHIGIMVSHGTNEEIMEATRGIAERWGIPYLDYSSPQVPLMNRYTGRNVCAKAQQIREKNFCVISDGTTATNGHPNTAAHEYESTFIEAWLRTL